MQMTVYFHPDLITVAGVFLVLVIIKTLVELIP